MGLLDDQVALIVGAAGGIGRGVVRRYLAEGASVLAADRSADRLAELVAEAEEHPRLATIAADAGEWAENRAMVARAVERFGGLDVLVSCVGVYDHGVRLVDIPGERLTAAVGECFQANVGTLLLGIRAALEPLAARRGRVVVTGSFAGHRTSGGGVLYTSAKHAVVGLVSQLAYELAPKIRVNGVAPGVAKTVMSGLRSLDQEPRDALLPGTEAALPLQALPHPDDYGAAYALLGSADSAVITGTVLVADSGLAIRGMAAPNLGADL